MADIATIYNKSQLGVEVTPGTAVTVNRGFNSLSFTPEIAAEVQMFRAQGKKYKSSSKLRKEWSEIGFAGLLDFNEITWILASLLNRPSPVGTGPNYAWGITPSLTGPDTNATYTLETGSTERAQKLSYLLCDAVVFNIDKGGVDFSGSAIGQKTTDDVTFTTSGITTPDIELVGDMDLYFADTAAGLDTADPLNRFLKGQLSMGNRFSPIWRIMSTDASFAGHIEKAPDFMFRPMLEADDEGMALLTTMRNNAIKYARLKATGSEIDTGVDYDIQIDMALRVKQPLKKTDKDGIYAIEWEMELVESSSWGNVLDIDLVNKVSTL